MSTTPIFSGNSRFATDFQAVIERSVAIASLPLTQFNAQKTVLGNQSAALSSLDAKFTSLQNAITSLETALAANSYVAASSDTTVLSATVEEGALPGTYSIEVTDLGSRTQRTSTTGVSDPAAANISASLSYTLTAGAETLAFTISEGTLEALAEAINESGLDVQATIVNLGSAASPSYRLSIEAEKYGAVAVQLNDGTADLLPATPETLGTDVKYKLNGSAELTSDSRSVEVGPHLTANLLAESAAGVAATITVSRSTAAVSNALASLANAYNAAVDGIDQHRGEGAGVLSGQSILNNLTQALRAIGQYSVGTGSIGSLTALGLSFDGEGHLSLDTTVFDSATEDNFSALADFLGSASGSGFLKTATDVLDGLQDETDGVIQTTLDSFEEQIENQDELIEAYEARIDTMRKALEAQMAAADALIAQLEQQALYINGVFESMRIAAEQYR